MAAKTTRTATEEQLPTREEAEAALRAGVTLDAVSVSMEEALDALGELTGRTAREEIVQQIFSRFCVGK